MKELLIFIYNYYEYYFYVFFGIVGSIFALHFCKNRLSLLSEKAISLFLILIENGIVSTWLIHHSIKMISGVHQPYLTVFLIKCLVMLGNGIIICFITVQVVLKLQRMKISGRNWFGIATFAYFALNLITNLPAKIDAWLALWYATDYSMGLGSRFFVGTLLKLFYTDYLDSKVAYNFCFICILIIIVLVSYLGNVLYCNCNDEYRVALSFVWIMFLVGPGSICGFWKSMNYGRLETYGFLIGIICFIVYRKIKNKNVSFGIITVMSCLSMAIYQGNIFMYYSLVLMIFIWEILSENNKNRKNVIKWGIVNVTLTSITFVFFQFFSSTIYSNASEMTAELTSKTDLPICESAIDLELFNPVSAAFDLLYKGFLMGKELPREKSLITIILTCPIIIMFMVLYMKCLGRVRQKGLKEVFRTPHLYFIILIFTIVPQFMLNVDWGRWMLCVNIILFSGFLYLVYMHDENAVHAMICLDRWIKSHRVIAIFVPLYLAGLGRFNGRSFIEQVNSITNWLVSNEWLVVR